MNDSIILDIVQNIAFLLTFSMLYDYFWARNENMKSIFYQIGAGIFMGGVGIVLILTPWTYKTGIIFDTRSIVLAISGLFFGLIPTVISMLIVGLYRIYLGGQGVYMGVAVIVGSGTIGILWHRFRPEWKKNNLLELAGLGIAVHVLMLGCTVLLPAEVRFDTFRNVLPTVLVIYPFATVLLGKIMIRQSENWENKKALDVSEERWHFALEGAGDGVWDWNPKTDEVFYSKRWKTMLGYDDEDIKNNFEAWKELVHEDDRERVYEVVARFINQENELFEAEQRLRCKDGSYKWILAMGKIMEFDAEGNPSRCIGTHKDISDRKEKELLLVHERFLLGSLMNFTPESIFFKDLDSRFLRVNHASARSMGFNNPEEVVGKSDFDIYSYEYASKTYRDEQEIIRTGSYLNEEEQGNLLDGTETWGITHKMALHDLKGNIAGTFGLSVDITEQKKIEKALRESEQYTNSILKAIPDLIFILNSEGVFLDFKTGNMDDLAMPKEQFIGKSVFDIFPDSKFEVLKDTLVQVMNNEPAQPIEYEMVIKDKVNTFECIILPFDGAKVMAMVRNITERKRVEVALKNSQEQLKSFAAHLQDIREEERVLLAREIHDELGQMLIALKIDLGIFKQEVIKSVCPNEHDETTFKFEQLIKLLDIIIKTTRKIMTGLRPELLELVGLTEAVRLHVMEFNNRYRIECRFDCRIAELIVESQQSIALFRILQEALNNVAKHSKATEVNVLLNIVGGKIILSIADNGIGIDPGHKIRPDSYGLIGMRERMYLLNGELTISSEPGQGTTVLVEMPYAGKPQMVCAPENV